MTEYVVDATNALEPTDDRPASYLGIEMRTLKGYLQTQLGEQATTNTGLDDAIQALEDILNVDTNVVGLPDAQGALTVILNIFKEVFGYTEGGTTYPSLASKLASLDTKINGALSSISSLTTIVNQHTSSINSMNNTLVSHTNSLSDHASTLNSHTLSINSINTSLANLQNATSTKLPVGSIYISMSGDNPASTLGYGTWVKTCLGRLPIGIGDGSGSGAINMATIPAGSVGGNLTKTLTMSNIPSHTHSYTVPTGTFNAALGVQSSPLTQAASSYKAKTTGTAGQDNPDPIYLTPVWQAFHFWRRTA